MRQMFRKRNTVEGNVNVLICCEESQEVCKAFRKRGHNAFSCDIQECSGGHPEWHIVGDALALVNGNCVFHTSEMRLHEQNGKWDLIIAHPPCTYLTSSGASRLFNADHTIKDLAREQKGWEAKDFFLRFLTADCDKIAVENPAPMHHFGLPPYSQIIEPYFFGDPWKKRTCLWLKGLPLLEADDLVTPTNCWVVRGGGASNRVKLKGPGGANTAKERSKTFPGVARAMSEQWG